MKNKVLSFYSSILSALLLFLGFTACNDSPDEYGAPSARYKINGTTVNADNQEVIPNIQVVIKQNKDYPGDTLITDREGKFNFEKETAPYNSLIIELKDIDGEANGEFKDKEIIINLTDSDFKNGNGWNKGTAEKKMGNIGLESVSKEK